MTSHVPGGHGLGIMPQPPDTCHVHHRSHAKHLFYIFISIILDFFWGKSDNGLNFKSMLQLEHLGFLSISTL